MSVTTATYNELVSQALRRRYGPLRHASKLVARAVGVSERTVQNWFDGSCGPRGTELIRLMIECDELAEEIRDLIERAKCSQRS